MRPLINIVPGSLNPLSGTLGDKPINLSDFEMNRGVKHVGKGSYRIYFIDRAEVLLSHAKFNLQVNYALVKSLLCNSYLAVLQNICLKSILRHIVSFCRLETKCLMKFAVRKITDIILRTGDLLRGEIPKIRFKLISFILKFTDGIEGRRSFRSIYSQIFGFNPGLLCREGKQNQANKRLKLRCNYNGLILSSSILVRTSELMVKLAQTYHIKLYSTLKGKTGLSPWFISGFTDAEGTFGINFNLKSTTKLGVTAIPLFQIGLHLKDELLLNNIREYFGEIGTLVYNKDKDVIFFKVQSLKQILTVIIPHFDKYPLITQKRADYLLFREIVLKMEAKEHLNMDGLQGIASIRASLNLGGMEGLITVFPNIVPVVRPIIDNPRIPDPEWVVGFVSGEGCFTIGIWKTPTNRLGVRVSLRFIITQHSRDEKLMRSFIEYFGCGNYNLKGDQNAGEYVVGKFSHLSLKIVPFFNKYRILGVKSLDFKDWSQAIELMKADKHLTEEGLARIVCIKEGMNKVRKFRD
uniref:LAGLIDADG endonuclease n=1 Tax=Monilinia fructicola TaxID=38448 RepID=A0A8F8SQC3_MONFR|nr:LAGLIDADG endonuclease [Monilinia fructicola]QYB19480.1 LAGLIDADG endonuclease [Monilinia fructicola]QYB19542.1 LAGLIDADG endonuclease [Monilinia fructicola]QYB19604.1 LAGLIDADG endonuclease [Monilinia fructicola]QYB19667.1 LAGLIDADG endonuclease [Monilinia fructicola]